MLFYLCVLSLSGFCVILLRFTCQQFSSTNSYVSLLQGHLFYYCFKQFFWTLLQLEICCCRGEAEPVNASWLLCFLAKNCFSDIFYVCLLIHFVSYFCVYDRMDISLLINYFPILRSPGCFQVGRFITALPTLSFDHFTKYFPFKHQ